MGIISIMLANSPVGVAVDFPTELSSLGLLGGSMWCLGNLCTVPIFNRLGLGRGLSLWTGISNVVGWLIGRFGVFGIIPEALRAPWLGILGLLFSMCGLCVVATVKMSTSTASSNNDDANDDTKNSNVTPLLPGIETSGNSTPDLENNAESAMVVNKNEKVRNAQGIMLASIAGSLYGFMYVPMTIYMQLQPPDVDIAAGNAPVGGASISMVLHEGRFFFSQFTGIFLTSTVCLLLYSLFKKPQQIANAAYAPAIISGMMWACANMGSMICSSSMVFGLMVGPTLANNGSFIINALWSLLYFKEVQNPLKFSGALVLISLGSVCMVLSK